MIEDSLKKRYSIKLFSNIIIGIIGVILVAIVPKALGSVSYGHFIYIRDFFTKIISFLDMGSSTAFFTKLSANNKRKELIVFYSTYILFIFTILLIFVIFIDSFNYINILLPNISIDYIYMGLFFGFFTFLTQIFIKISDAYALTVSVELIKIVYKVLSLFLLLYFIYQTDFDLTKYFIFHLITLVSFLLILSWLFIKKGIFKNFKFSILNSKFSTILKEFIEYCSPLVIYNVIGILAGLFDIWILQKTAGSEQTGFYGLAYSLASICFLFTSAMTPIITREFAKSYGQKNLKEMRKLFFRYIPMLYSIAGYFAIFVSFQSKNLLDIFTNNEFQSAYLVVSIMAFYPIHQTYGQLSGSVFYATGQTKLMRNISFFTQPLGMSISFILIYLLDLGAIGLALKMIIVQFIGVNIQLYFNSKFLDFRLKYFLSHQLYSILFFIVLAFISTYILSFDLAILNFVVSGLIYTVLVIIFTYFFPQIFAINREEINNILYGILNVIKRKIKK